MRTKEEIQRQIQSYQRMLADAESLLSDAVLQGQEFTATLHKTRATCYGGFISTLDLLADIIEIDVEDIRDGNLPFMTKTKEEEL
tara:strand:- start:7259 stop:7513 length:255 start_codon:yes stop_codon:yes gene_type:complete